MKVLILALVMFISLPIRVSATTTTLYFDPASIRAGVGSTIQVKVMLDTGSEKINAIGATIKYPVKLLKLKSWSDGNSIISFWIQPTMADFGSITMQGMVPGGYQGAKGQLLTLNFDVIGEGSGNLSLSGASEALINDGKGTAASLRLSNAAISVKGVGSKDMEKIEDTIPPESFQIFVSRDPNLFDNKYFAVFATQDKGSGVDRYEISENLGVFKPTPANWVVAESPIALRDQKLRSWIFVKAIDMNGNERVEVLIPSNIPVYQQPGFIIFLILLVLGLLYGKRKKLFK